MAKKGIDDRELGISTILGQYGLMIAEENEGEHTLASFEVNPGSVIDGKFVLDVEGKDKGRTSGEANGALCCILYLSKYRAVQVVPKFAENGNKVGEHYNPVTISFRDGAFLEGKYVRGPDAVEQAAMSAHYTFMR